MKNHLVVTVLAPHRPDLAARIAKIADDAGCELLDSRMGMLGSEFAITLLAHGNWSTLARLETQLQRMEQTEGFTVQTRRSEPAAPRTGLLPYAVEAISAAQPGVVTGLLRFFAGHRVGIEDLVSRSYVAPHTGTAMFSVNMVVGVPADVHVGTLRDEFMDYCDRLNLDAVMEPVKG